MDGGIARMTAQGHWQTTAFLAILAGIAGFGTAHGQVPPGSPLPGIARPAPAPVAPATPETPAVAPAPVPEGQTFSISSAMTVGGTAYSAATLNRFLAGLTGPAVPLERIEAARAALLTLYRRDGYTYTTVRARIRGGVLRLTITEPRIVAVTLSQDIGPAGAQVLRFLDHLADGRLLTEGDLERWLLLANDVPGVTVRAVLDPTANDPGALTLRAQVERRAANGMARADNRAFRLTGPEQSLLVGDLNSFTSLGERTEASLYRTFNNTNIFGQLSEEFFIGRSGLKLRLYGGAGENTPSGSLRQIGYNGVTRIFGAALSYPVIRSRQHNLTVAAQFDAIESDIAYNVITQGSRASYDSLRILRADVLDTYSDILFGPGLGATTTAEATLSQGLPILGAVSNRGRQLPRLNQQSDFTKGVLRFDRTQFLFSPYTYNGTAAGVQLDIAAQGQYANAILPPEEKYYLGGPEFNRGFYFGEVTGDRALAARIEPRLTTALPSLPHVRLVPQATFYMFADWGEAWQNQNTDLGRTLRSIGGGARIALGDYLEIDLEGVSRLTRTPAGAPPVGQRVKSAAFYWGVVGKF